MASADHRDRDVISYLERTLPGSRMFHVRGVMSLAERLAKKHGLSPSRARLAGALHDVARCWSRRKLVRYARRHRLKVPNSDFMLRSMPVLLHSYVSAHMAGKVFRVRDREILTAIAKHSLGSTTMTRFEKVVYLADLLAHDRKFNGVERLRRLAFQDVEKAFVEGVRSKMQYLLTSGAPIHPECVKVWNHWVSRSTVR